MYVLTKRLYQIGAEIINVNTDGVVYKLNKGVEDSKILKQWQDEFKFTLEYDYFDKWIQKDVNNYIAVEPNGKVVTKGGDANKYKYDKFFANNDIRIVQIALVDYLLYGKSINKTIIENLDKPILYQYVLKAGGTYKGVALSSNPDKLLSTKVNRVFAVKGKGEEIVKVRQDGGLVKFADAPTDMFIWNRDVNELKNFDVVVDKQWYADLTNSKVDAWL